MENKLILALMVVLGLSLLANALLIKEVSNQRSEMAEALRVTGFSTKAEEPALLKSDVIEIGTDELNQCCSFINEQGEQDSCYVLKHYDCSYCEEYCN
jgi:hypothetical protein